MGEGGGFVVIMKYINNTTDFIFNVNLTLKVNVNKNIANHFHCCYRKRANNIYIINEHFH